MYYGFNIGKIRPIFHRLGMLSVEINRFMSLVIYAILIGPKFFSIIGAMLSGPKAFEFLVERIARFLFFADCCRIWCELPVELICSFLIIRYYSSSERNSCIDVLCFSIGKSLYCAP